jgi:four helix bundle protein
MLDVISITMQAAAAAYRLTSEMPKGKNLGDQLRRAADSGALNTAEGMGFMGARRVNFLNVAYASCREAQTASQLLAVTGRIDLDGGRQLWRLLDRAGAMLYRMRR